MNYKLSLFFSFLIASSSIASVKIAPCIVTITQIDTSKKENTISTIKHKETIDLLDNEPVTVYSGKDSATFMLIQETETAATIEIVIKEDDVEIINDVLVLACGKKGYIRLSKKRNNRESKLTLEATAYKIN